MACIALVLFSLGGVHGAEHINGLELYFKNRDHLTKKWETLSPDGTQTHFEFELVRKM
jgi:hypothetical protein